jgi:hypothetical protein
VADHRDLLNPDVTDEDVAAMTLLTAPSMGFYVGVVLLALLAPTVAAFGYLARCKSLRAFGMSAPRARETHAAPARALAARRLTGSSWRRSHAGSGLDPRAPALANQTRLGAGSADFAANDSGRTP